MAEQVPQAVAGGAIAQGVQNPQPAQNREVCIFFCFGYHVVDYISVANFYR